MTDIKQYEDALKEIEKSHKKLLFDIEITEAMQRFMETRIKYLKIADEGMKIETEEPNNKIDG